MTRFKEALLDDATKTMSGDDFKVYPVVAADSEEERRKKREEFIAKHNKEKATNNNTARIGLGVLCFGSITLLVYQARKRL